MFLAQVLNFSLPLKNPVTIFTLVLVILLIVPFLLRKIRVPAIIGLILSGVIIGPEGIGLLEMNSAVELFSTIGLLYIMFLAGLELDLNQFKSSKYKSIVFGFFTFIIPLFIGFPVCYYLLDYSFNTSLLTASMFSTHTLIAYPIVSRLGISKSEPVAISVGGTILTDTLVLVILAINIGIATGTTNTFFWIRLGISLIIFSFLTFYLIPKISGWFFRNFESEKNSHFIYALTIVFVLAMAAELAGLEPIIGAFMAGLALNRLVPNRSSLMNRIEFVGNALFIPFFLVSIGMVVDLKVLLQGPYALIIASVLTIVALISKWLAAFVTQLSLNYNKNQRNIIFGLSSSHAIATLAIISVGYNAGILDDNILNGTIILIFITCLVASVVTENASKKILLEEQNSPVLKSGEEKIMVLISNPVTLNRLIDLAILIKNPKDSNEINAVSVVEEHDNIYKQYEKNRKILDEALEHALSADFKVNLYTKVDINIAGGIVRAAKESFSSVLVLGFSPKKDLFGKIIGNILDNIVENYKGTIFVCRPLNPFNIISKTHIVVPEYAEKEPGFNIWFEKSVSLVNNLASSINFYCSSLTEKNIKESYSSAPGEFYTMVDYNYLSSVPRGTENDLYIFIGSRKGLISYQTKLETLPSVLPNYYNNSNIIIIYPEIVETVNHETLGMFESE